MTADILKPAAGSLHGAAESLSTQARNLAFAFHEKLAFSSLVDPVDTGPVLARAALQDQDDGASISLAGSRRTTLSSADAGSKSGTRRDTSQSLTLQSPPLPLDEGPDLTFQAPEAKDAWSGLSELQRARDALAQLILTRVRDFQLLTGRPLQGKRRTPAQLARLLDQAEEEGSEGSTWQALGMFASPFHEPTHIPDLTRTDLWGPLDILLALAGHLDTSGSSAQVPSLFALHPSPSPPTHTHLTLSDTQPTLMANQATQDSRHTGHSTNTHTHRPQDISPLQYPSLLLNQGGVTGTAYGSGGGLPRSMSMSCVSRLHALRDVKGVTSDWLRAFLADLRPQQRHVGVDDRTHTWFRSVKVQAARQLIQEGSIPLCKGFAKYGVPHGCRAGVWEVALGLTPGELPQAEVCEFESLVHEACCQPLLCDVWAHSDSLRARDSEQYFLFEEILRAVHLAFLRDTRVATRCSVKPFPCVHIQGAHRPAIQPVHKGTLMLAGPLCFMYSQPAAVYRMHRALYCRYWCKLHSLHTQGAPSPALPVLLKTVEDLMQELDPELIHHLTKLGVPCVALTLPWICNAFVGYLPVEEVLLLWDRVVGLDSLLPVAVLAVAVLCFRRQVLLSCAAAKEVHESMADLSQLQTVPLLQAVLFQG